MFTWEMMIYSPCSKGVLGPIVILIWGDLELGVVIRNPVHLKYDGISTFITLPED